MIIKKGKFDRPLPREYLTKVGIISDTHIGYESWGDYSSLDTAYDLMNTHEVDLYLMLGDIIDSGYDSTPTLRDAQRDIYFEKNALLNAPVFTIRGNHDANIDEFTQRGVVQIGDVRFIALWANYVSMTPPDGNDYWSTGKFSQETLEYLEEELIKGDGKTNIILCHYSIADTDDFVWSVRDLQTDVNGDEFDGLADDVIALCNTYGAKLYLNGHEHHPGLVSGVINGLTDMHIGSGRSVFVILTVYTDNRYVFEEYSSDDGSLLNTVELNL